MPSSRHQPAAVSPRSTADPSTPSVTISVRVVSSVCLAMMLALAAQTRTCPPAPMAYIEAWGRGRAHGRQVEERLREPL